MTGIVNRDNRDSYLVWLALSMVVAASKSKEAASIALDPQDLRDMERLLDASGNQDSQWELVPEEEILRRQIHG
jgi:hypothetical protein